MNLKFYESLIRLNFTQNKVRLKYSTEITSFAKASRGSRDRNSARAGD